VAFAVFAVGAVAAWIALRPVRPTTISEGAGVTNGDIAFEVWSPTDVRTEHLIYTVNPERGKGENVTPDAADYASPAWSPDGKSLAVVRADQEDQVGIYTMSADGSDLHRLVNIGQASEENVRQVAWSPDGTQIAFIWVEWVDPYVGNWIQHLYVMDIAEDTPRLLTEKNLQVWAFSWSPDGDRIVFAAQPLGASRADLSMYMIDAVGGAPSHIPDSDGSDPAWSPDGSKIAFAGHAAGAENPDIFVMDVNGTERTRLTTDSAADFWPVWSPDGTLIVFQRQEPGGGAGAGCALVLMNADGSSERTLVSGDDVAGCPWHPTWQPIPNVQAQPT
jgi:TolB protein